MGVVPVGRYLESLGLTWDDVEFTKLPISDLATALELGSVDAAWLNSPAHLPFEEQGTATLVAQYNETEVATGIAFGPRLLRNNPEIGQGFIRAIIRTIQTHLGEGYKSNTKVALALAKSLKISESQVASSNELKFLFELDPTLQTKAQELWVNFGDILSYTKPLDPEEYLDPRFTRSIVLE
jgi:ABC-type nitrate/sulfonate/bicarbonate transport system substrate-binding protein